VRTRLPVKVKLAVVSAALTFVILCLFAVVIGTLTEQRIRDNFDDDLRATASDLQNSLTPELNPDGSYALDPDDRQLLTASGTGDAEVRVLTRRGGRMVFPHEGVPDLGPPIDGVVDAGELRVVSRPLVAGGLEEGGTFDPLPRPVARTVGWVQYAKPERSVQQTVNRVRVFLAFGVLGGTLLAFFGGMLVARRAMRPIAGLTRAAREVARTRDPDIALPAPRANDEVSDLAHTFEDMLRELSEAHDESEAALARQREFVADASHELRTPLTSILANLELLEGELEGEQQEMAASALRSSRRMRRLVADLLLLARADAGREATMAPVDLAAIAREAAAEAAALSADHPISLDAPERVTVTGVADDLHRLAGNLVENALIHTPSGTPVTVSVRRDGPSAVLEVADRGPGVPPDMRERVFERFARAGGDGERRRGSGLGLAIVRAVVDAHGGSVDLLDAEGGGARFVVTLPAAGAQAPEPPAPLRQRALRSRR
jgi:two-component system OmpR family sensor kinase